MSDELLQYRHFVSKQQFDKDLTDEQEEEVLAQFAALDPEKKGHVEWSDFLYFESLAVLRKFRTEVKYTRVRKQFIQEITIMQCIQFLIHYTIQWSFENDDNSFLFLMS